MIQQSIAGLADMRCCTSKAMEQIMVQVPHPTPAPGSGDRNPRLRRQSDHWIS